VEQTLLTLRHHKDQLQFPDPGSDKILPIQESKNPVRRYRFPERSLDPRLLFALDFFSSLNSLTTEEKVYMTIIYEMVGNLNTFVSYCGIPLLQDWNVFVKHLQSLKNSKRGVFFN